MLHRLRQVVQSLRLPYREDTIFSLTFFLVLFCPLVFTSIIIDGYEAPKFALFLLVSGALLFAAACRRELRLMVQPVLLWASVLFLAWFIITGLLGHDILASFIGLSARYGFSVLFFMPWFAFIAIAGGNWAQSVGRQEVIMRTVAVVAFLVALLGILQQYQIGYYAGPSASFHFVVPGFLGNQNFSAMYLAGALPLLWYFLQRSRGWLLLLWSVMQVVVVWGLALTSSRGAILAAGVAFVLWLVLLGVKRQWTTLLRIAAPSLILFALLSAAFAPLLREVSTYKYLGFNNSQVTVDSRKLAWLDALQVVTAHPVLGIGAWNFLTQPQDLVRLISPLSERYDDPHNIFVHLALAGGYLLLLLSLLMLGWLTYLAWRRYHGASGSVAVYAWLGLVGILVAMQFNPVAVPCWLLLGLLVALLLADTSLVTFVRWRLVPRWLTIFAAVCLMVFAVLFFAGHYVTTLARNAYSLGRYAQEASLAQLAMRLAPWELSSYTYYMEGQLQNGVSPRELLPVMHRYARLHPLFPGKMESMASFYAQFYIADPQPVYREAMNRYLADLAAVEPAVGSSYSFAANLYNYTGQPELAIFEARYRLVNPVHRTMLAWAMLGRYLLQAGDVAGAHRAVAEAIRIEPYPTELRKALIEFQKSGLKDTSKFPIQFPQ